jgi:hypothetical protein
MATFGNIEAQLAPEPVVAAEAPKLPTSQSVPGVLSSVAAMASAPTPSTRFASAPTPSTRRLPHAGASSSPASRSPTSPRRSSPYVLVRTAATSRRAAATAPSASSTRLLVRNLPTSRRTPPMDYLPPSLDSDPTAATARRTCSWRRTRTAASSTGTCRLVNCYTRFP